MRKERDERINVRHKWVGDFVAQLMILLVVNAGYLLIFMTIYGIEPTVANMLRFETVSYMVFFSLLLTGLTTLLRSATLDVPMQRLGEAARQIAKGDFSVRVAPLRKDGKKDYVEVMFDDFNTMAEELSSIETLKDDFIGNVSHEMKTPLAVIHSYATALEQEDLTQEQRREYIKTIASASRGISTLVTNILKLNRLENQEIVPESHPYDLGEQLRRCALAVEDLWENKGLSFTADIADHIWVRCDKSMMELVWSNLLSNAIKFTDEGGAIGLMLEEKGGFAIASVMDTGCGMKDETVKHIFDKFYQGDTSRAQEGNGLGLALAHRVVELVGGEMLVESIEGRGTTFIVKLKTA